MIEIPFTKLHGAENDFLLTWREKVEGIRDLAEAARRICARNTGIGGDGWMLVEPAANRLKTRLFNSDGSEAEISGNGTRCAAAFALLEHVAEPPIAQIVTAAGEKTLRVLERRGNHFLFEMDMGEPKVEELRALIEVRGREFDATVLNVGNPQCAMFFASFPEDWREVGRAVERHIRFPNGSNVSFVRVVDRHAIDVLFWERGAGETRSSGTGSTGAAVAAISRGLCDTPVKVHTPAGSLHLRWEESVYLTGPAELVGEGRYFFDP
jgi:diaminopimelate epimerase